MIRRVLSDEMWHQFEAAADISDREFLEAVFFLARTGTSWRDPPAELRTWSAVYMRFRQWEESKVWSGVWNVLQQDSTPLVLQLFVDSNSIRCIAPSRGATKNAARPALGRSRGGLGFAKLPHLLGKR